MKDDKKIKIMFLISTILVAWLIKIIAFDGFLIPSNAKANISIVILTVLMEKVI